MFRRKVDRKQLVEFFATLQPCTVVMEACCANRRGCVAGVSAFAGLLPKDVIDAVLPLILDSGRPMGVRWLPKSNRPDRNLVGCAKLCPQPQRGQTILTRLAWPRASYSCFGVA